MASKAIGQITLTQVHDGKEGKSPIQVLLSNETHTLAADYLGNVISYDGAETYIYVFDGAEDVTSKYFISAVENGITGTLDSNRYVVTSITNKVGGTVEFVCVGPDRQSISKVFSVSLSLAGKDGTNGKDGTPGPAGADGKTTYFHVKYAPVQNPTKDQMTETPDKFIGTYVDVIEEDSDDPLQYTWIQIQGTDGIPGTNGVDGKTSYLHIKYSDDGGKTFTESEGETPGKYIGTYVDFNVKDSTLVTDYQWSKFQGEDGKDGLPGIDGKDGINGRDGVDGKSTYFHIKYSEKEVPTTKEDMTETPSIYIGTYVDEEPGDSDDPTKYTWARFQGIQGKDGTDGIPGVNGKDGQTSFFHVKYSNDGGKTFTSNKGEDSGDWIGQYVDFTEVDSEDVGDYNWTKIKGEAGKDATGISSIKEQYYQSTSTSECVGSQWVDDYPGYVSGKYIWTRSVIFYTDKTTKTTDPICVQGIDGKNGIDGVNGKDGTSVTIKGSYDTLDALKKAHPTGSAGDSYLVAGDLYVWSTTSKSWENVGTIQGPAGKDGTNGTNGKDGTNGIQGYSIVTSITKSSVSEADWTTYGTIGHSQTWTGTSSLRNNCRVNDLFLVVGTSTAGKAHTLIYKSTTASGDLTGTCIASVLSEKGTDGKNGTNGIGISNVDVQYYLSSSATELKGGSWSTTAPEWVNGKYMWSKTITTYTNSTTKESSPVCITGQKGQNGTNGTSASLVTINASSQMFKSKTGSTGTFNPQYIYLYPYFQVVKFSKWEYSIDGTTWTTVTSGQHSLTVATYSSVANTLRIERTSDLFNSTSFVTFRCSSNDSKYYDTCSIIKVYDTADLKVGGRNFILNSNFVKGIVQRETGSEGWSIPTDNTALSARTKFNGHYSLHRYRTGITKDTWSELQYYHMNTSTEERSEDEEWVFSFWAKTDSSAWIGADDVSTHACRAFDSSGTKIAEFGMGALQNLLKANVGKWVRFVGKFKIPKSTKYKYFYIYDSINRNADYYLTDFKLEKGNIVTDWTPAPEDSSDIIYSTTTPANPIEGMLWYNISNGVLSLYTKGEWITQDLSNYPTFDYVDNQISSNSSKVYITKPKPPYFVGDVWIVQDKSDPNFGKMLTCLKSRAEGNYTESDWFVPLTAYTTLTQMTNVLGTDPSEWSSTSKSIKTLINENTDKIAGVSEQASKLAVRSSEIEMSFSKTGTMNFLGNSSGQNGVKLWSFHPNAVSRMSTASANEASDVRNQLVSGNAFRFNSTWSGIAADVSTLWMNSAVLVPPTSDTYTISLKLKNLSKRLDIRVRVYSYSDTAGKTSLGVDELRVPYATNNTGEFFLEHLVINKKKYNQDVMSILVQVCFLRPEITTATSLPTYNANYIGRAYKVSDKYYYGTSAYTKMTIIESVSKPALQVNQIWKCLQNVPNSAKTGYDYLAGYYYEKDVSGKYVPITDSYVITMLDKDTYYKRLPTGWETLSGVTDTKYLSPVDGSVYFGDIMLNGGSMVMTWTPRQDENMWGENIKFNSDGIVIEDKSRGYKRVLDESSDISWLIDSNGNIVSCVWKLTQDGFITKDIRCYGTFYMGKVADEKSSNIENNFTKVMSMSRSSDNKGVDEYIYT